MPTSIFAVLTVAILMSIGSITNAGYYKDSNAASACPLDNIYDSGEISSNMITHVDETMCRLPSDMDCMEKYGNLTVFSHEIQRCAWTLPTGVTLPKLQIAPIGGVGPNRCALIRLLHTMLSAMQPEGVRVLPWSISGEIVTPLRCGSVDLQPWSMENVLTVRAPAVHLETGVRLSVLNEEGRLQRSLSTPVWVVPIFIILSVLGAVGLMAVAVLAWRIHSVARTAPPTGAVSVASAATMSWGHSPRVGDDEVSGCPTASSASVDTQRPPCLSVASDQTPCSLDNTITMPLTPREIKSGNEFPRLG
ncbi:hypothetical protein LSM04_004022 [Trypanosoma melophagium]|uniref:uncharacterized protein n=1 Tax=Trypanosoma melophagium TaxID=715481 RepID=UPI003519EB96|nr:hypothetical protein LSM04_004022 [Trypanosoma melophagium]